MKPGDRWVDKQGLVWNVDRVTTVTINGVSKTEILVSRLK